MKTMSRGTLLLLSFALPCVLMAAVFALCGLAPFGTATLGVMDMSHQYISFLASLRDILSGRADLLYLPSMCLGGNMTGVFAYYLVSPLNLLCCLFPREQLFTAVSLTYLLRVGLAGLAMCVYCGCRRGWRPGCLVPSLAYAFMAYLVAYSFNYLWQDCVVLLPVIALGIVRLRGEGRPWLYVISLAAALLLNFYIGYILCLFSVLFFLFELLSVPRRERPDTGRTLLRFVLASLAAGGLAAVLLMPAFLSLQGGKASFDLSLLTLEAQFGLPEFLSKFFPAAFRYEEIMPEGLPQVFCGTVTVCLCLLYFVNRNVPVRRRLLALALLLVLVLSCFIRALDLVWHGFNVPTWYNCRYSFLLSFVMAAAADAELSELSGTRARHLLLPLIVVAGAAALVFIGREYAYVTWRSGAAAAVLTALVCAALLIGTRKDAGKRLAAVLGIAVLLLQTGELAVNAKLSLDSLTAQSTDARGFADYAAAKADAFSQIDPGTAFVRVESPVSYSQNRCEPMLFGYDGISHYGSTLSQKSLDFLDRLGFDRYDLWAQYGPGVTAAADTLLGVRCLVSDTVPKGYIARWDNGRYTVFENPDALPVGFTVDAAVSDPIAAEDSFAYLDALYAAAAPETDARIFVRASVSEPETENYRRDGDRFTRAELAPAKLTYTVTPAADGPLYAEFDIPEYPGVMLFAGGVMRAWTATAQTNGTVYLGDYAAGEAVTVTLQASADITVARASFATEDASAVARYARALSGGGCTLTKISSSRYIGTYAAGEGDALLLLTLPYDSSWHVTLDGRRVSPAEVQDCLMAVETSPGTHTVELRYIPAGLLPGACVSVLALAACVVFALRGRRQKKT